MGARPCYLQPNEPNFGSMSDADKGVQRTAEGARQGQRIGVECARLLLCAAVLRCLRCCGAAVPVLAAVASRFQALLCARRSPLLPYSTVYRELSGAHLRGRPQGQRWETWPAKQPKPPGRTSFFFSSDRPQSASPSVWATVVREFDRRRREAQKYSTVASGRYSCKMQSVFSAAVAATAIMSRTKHP